MKCPKCGFENSDNSKFCINCAGSLSVSSSSKICPNCRSENPSQAKFCYNCATKLLDEFLFNPNQNSNREEELKQEIERLKANNVPYTKKKSGKLKWAALGTILILIIALPISYMLWFKSFQTQTQKSIQETSQGGGLQLISITDDGKNYYINLRNNGSEKLFFDRFCFSRDGVYASSCNPSNYTMQYGETKTFSVKPNGYLSKGTTHKFVINCTDVYGKEVPGFETKYTDS